MQLENHKSFNKRKKISINQCFIFLVIAIFAISIAKAATNPFEIDYAKIRTPSGLNATSTVFNDLVAKPYTGGAAAEASLRVNLGKATSSIPMQKIFTNTALAGSAAAALIGKTPLTFMAALALPYAIDAVTGDVIHQTTSAPTPYPTQPLTTGCTVTYQTPAEWCTATYPPLQMRAAAFYIESGKVKFQCQYPAPNDALIGTPGTRQCQTTFDDQCSGANTWNSDYSKCRIPCTAPSTYDSATGTCSGSAINEPANAAQLEQDINDTFNNNPAAAPIVLDDLLQHDVNPTSTPTSIGTPLPDPVPGGQTVETTNSFDPATGHPITTTKITDKNYNFEQSGPNQVDIKPESTTTTTITDNITNITTTTTNTTIQNPSDANEAEDPKTDCDKYPDAVGCATLGELPSTDLVIPTENITLSILPGSSPARTCPAPYPIVTSRGTFHINFDAMCTGLDFIRTLLLAFTWLFAIRYVASAAKTA